jgi:hypothetical protein
MIKSKTVDKHTVELRTGDDSDFTSSIHIDGALVGCDALLIDGCTPLFNEICRDKSGEKARYVLDIPH